MGGRGTATGIELFFSPSSITVPAGAVTFALTNPTDGFHNMLIAIEVGGDALATSESVGPHQSALFAVHELAPGTYDFWCSIADHLELGMAGTLTVTP